MNKINKRIKSATYISQFESIFKCPVCASPMRVCELRSLKCLKGHSFDLARQGYINLATRQVQTKYNKELFEERNKLISEVGFFDTLHQEIIKQIRQHITQSTIRILDVGCGEGSHLARITHDLNTFYGKKTTGVGIDIARDGVIVATKYYPNHIWTVADLANAPFNNNQFDVILNLLSPSNYVEFNRLLKSDGIVIKVIPQRDYLKELREFFYTEAENESYSNAETIELFKGNYQFFNYSTIKYTKTLNQQSLQSLVRMTPLTWNVPEERIKLFLQKDLVDVTVDLQLLIGKN